MKMKGKETITLNVPVGIRTKFKIRLGLNFLVFSIYFQFLKIEVISSVAYQWHAMFSVGHIANKKLHSLCHTEFQQKASIKRLQFDPTTVINQKHFCQAVNIAN